MASLSTEQATCDTTIQEWCKNRLLYVGNCQPHWPNSIWKVFLHILDNLLEIMKLRHLASNPVSKFSCLAWDKSLTISKANASLWKWVSLTLSVTHPSVWSIRQGASTLPLTVQVIIDLGSLQKAIAYSLDISHAILSFGHVSEGLRLESKWRSWKCTEMMLPIPSSKDHLLRLKTLHRHFTCTHIHIHVQALFFPPNPLSSLRRDPRTQHVQA